MNKRQRNLLIQTIALAFGIVAIIVNLNSLNESKKFLFDIGSFIAAGQNAEANKNPYEASSPLIFDVTFPVEGVDWVVGGKMPNLNPPLSIVIFKPLAQTRPLEAKSILGIFSALIYGLSIVLLTKLYKTSSHLKVLWALSLAGFWHTLELGQIYGFLLLALALALYFDKNGSQIISGVFIGVIIALKPNFILLPIVLLLSGEWKNAVSAFATATVLSIIPLFYFDPEIYLQWLDASKLSISTLTMPGNSSLPGLISRFGDINKVYAISILFIFGSMIIFWRKTKITPSPNAGFRHKIHEFGIILSLLASPISWVGYTILLLPFFLSRKEWSLPTTIAAIILDVPFVIVLALFPQTYLNFILSGWLYGWALLLVFYVVFSDNSGKLSMGESAAIKKSIQTN